MIKSGQMPRSENGKSSCWTMVPQTPFCPCLLLNLSPTYMNEIIFQKFRGSSKLTTCIQHDNDSITSGLRVWRINDLTHKLLRLSEKRATLSTTQDSPSGPLYFWKADLQSLHMEMSVIILNQQRPNWNVKIKQIANLSFNPDLIGPLVTIGTCLFRQMSPDLIISPGAAMPSSSRTYRRNMQGKHTNMNFTRGI